MAAPSALARPPTHPLSMFAPEPPHQQLPILEHLANAAGGHVKVETLVVDEAGNLVRMTLPGAQELIERQLREAEARVSQGSMQEREQKFRAQPKQPAQAMQPQGGNGVAAGTERARVDEVELGNVGGHAGRGAAATPPHHVAAPVDLQWQPVEATPIVGLFEAVEALAEELKAQTRQPRADNPPVSPPATAMAPDAAAAQSVPAGAAGAANAAAPPVPKPSSPPKLRAPLGKSNKRKDA
jgi:hypothetical protein